MTRTIGFIGAGNMAEAMIRGLLRLDEVTDTIKPEALVISIAARVPVATIQAMLASGTRVDPRHAEHVRAGGCGAVSPCSSRSSRSA